MKHLPLYLLLCLLPGLLILPACSDDDSSEQKPAELLQLISVKISGTSLQTASAINGIAVDKPIVLRFSEALDKPSAEQAIKLQNEDGQAIPLSFNYLDQGSTVSAQPAQNLENNHTYTLTIGEVKAVSGSTFPGTVYQFTTLQRPLLLASLTVDGQTLPANSRVQDISLTFMIRAVFSEEIDPAQISAGSITVRGREGLIPLEVTAADEKTLLIRPLQPIDFISRYQLQISPDFYSNSELAFKGYSSTFYTQINPTPAFPVISDEALLTLVQEQTFKYFWDFAHPVSGLARERTGSGDLVTIGGSGFGVMAILAGIERAFISRQEGINRLERTVNFLENADRFHGVWPHWMNGSTGKVIAFSSIDNGGDLIETAFMIQGLLTVRQYLNPADPKEAAIIATITRLWEEVEWDWYTRGQNVLYWHWSPNYEWQMNMPIRGYNEGLIAYVLAAASPTHSIHPAVYHEGWARGGAMRNGRDFYGITLPLGEDLGGPLFFAHYSYLGLDPRNLEDRYANYWEQNVNHTRINRAYVIDNPKNWVGYGEDSWGLTASDNPTGYSAHSPTNDLGVITPTAALSSFPYTPEASMAALRHFYYGLGNRLWGPYGFYDAFDLTRQWIASSYLAIDQGPIIIMIENYRTQLFWNLFMKDPQIQSGLRKLDFTSF